MVEYLIFILPPPHPPTLQMVEERVGFPCAGAVLDYSCCYENDSLGANSEIADVDSG